MRFIGLLIVLAIIGYLFYARLSPESSGALQAQALSSSMSKDGLPPTTKKTAPGIAIERAHQVQGLNAKRTEGVDKVLEDGLGR